MTPIIFIIADFILMIIAGVATLFLLYEEHLAEGFAIERLQKAERITTAITILSFTALFPLIIWAIFG